MLRVSGFFLGSLSSGERTQWVPFSLLFVCKCELTEFLAELTEFAAELSEFSPPKQYSRNSIPPDSYELTMRSKFTLAQCFATATPAALTQFSWVLQAFLPSTRVSQRSKYGGGGGVVKTLRRSDSLSRSIFSTAGSFGFYQGQKR